MSDNRDWQKDKETIKYLQSWRLDPGGTEDSAAFYTIENDVYTDTKADGMLLEDALTLNDAFLALEHYHKQYAAEKQRADIAELAYHGLKEACVTIGEYKSLRDKHTAMTKAYWAEKERAEKAKELLIDAIGVVVMFSGGGNHHVKRILGEIRALYPVMDKEAEA